MSDIDITSQENTLELPKFEESLPDIKPEPRKDLKYEIKHEPKPSFGQSSKDLIEQYKSKFNAFKQLAEDQQPLAMEPSVIEKSEKSDIWRSDAEILKSPKEWDWNILGSKKASTTSNQIQFDTHVPDPIASEQEHKAQIAQHRQMILGVLDQRVEPGLKLPSSHQPSKPVVNEQHSNYQNILEKFRSASSLDDLNLFFNTVQQRKVVEQAAPQQQLEDAFTNIDIRRNKKAETQIQQYKTPSKSQEEIFEYGSGNRTTSFFQKKPSAQKQLLQSPNLGNQFNYRPDQSVTSKVTQNMNFQVEVKDHSKTNKRKEELQSFMGKLGLGKYDTPKVVINLDSNTQSNSTIDRMRQYVNGTPMSARKNGGGLSDLINERSLNTTTFKQQIKSYHKSGSKPDQTGRLSADNQNLSEQSLKNLHLKLVHQQKNGIGNSGLKYARC
ncbi:unnamed protein product [Paramecium pentaurelia]|uniref:Uncharacterized protein n=1 Tax=Paramecium pentaurelia TaxID=43138 RepID=A0A8S1Y593_9CILI|nr:unnamed protein product [Paramecium pentaurelia]